MKYTVLGVKVMGLSDMTMKTEVPCKGKHWHYKNLYCYGLQYHAQVKIHSASPTAGDVSL